MQPGIDAFQADHEQIAALARLTYLNTLPPKRAKPGIKSNGRMEWTILAAFVLSFPTSPQSCQYALISLATGLKCLPYTALPPNGDVLHDQHAEVLARRGARQWLLSRLQHEVGSHNEQALRLFESASSEEAVGRRTWRLKDGVRLHLYVSTLPCGDASNTLLEFQRAAQDQVAGREGALTPTDLLQLHANGPNTSGITATIGTGGSGAGSVVRGRASSSHQQSTQAASGGTGSLRTKPGRPDAPPSTSMSCSDKLALWNAPGIGIQGSLLSSLLEPVYIHSITMSDHPTRHIFPAFPLHPTEQATCEKQRRALKRILLDHCRRALQRARKPDTQEIALGWSAEPFADSKEIKLEQAWSAMTSNASFSEHSPTQELETFKARYEPVSCSNSVLYIRDPRFESNGMKGKIENLGNGTRMGAPTKRPKPTDPMGAESEPLKPPARSAVCRLNYFQTFVSAFHSITASGTPLELQDASYGDVKEGFFGQGTKAYRMRKLQLLGSKEDALQMVENFLHGARDGTAIKAVQQADATVMKQEDRQRIPEGNQDVNMLKGWLRSPISLSRFNLQGRTTCAVQADI